MAEANPMAPRFDQLVYEKKLKVFGRRTRYEGDLHIFSANNSDPQGGSQLFKKKSREILM